ncbi:PREDICTED: psbP-like protein 1, chloroplastic isoform X2 [Ipomoea nil]|uniref:psbP-like protein 1, chloroplastic isoform X2 n=1 Tax=Ipomoea nil TaxID=35883 RepID=UPI0009019EF4|nr:PREDICTED: psbP-like protein 1, chloroplastic isoform X2 [Ipomoea nil]
MVSLQEFQTIHHSCFPRASPQLGGLFRNVQNRRHASFLVRSEQVPVALTSSSPDQPQRRQVLALGAIICPLLISMQTKTSFAAESKKGFLPVTDKKDGYSFVYPFGWQEVVVEGQDKVFKDVIEPLESVSVNVFPTTKQDIRDFGSAQEVAETLITKVLASPSQKTKLIEVKEVHDVLTLINLLFHWYCSVITI